MRTTNNGTRLVQERGNFNNPSVLFSARPSPEGFCEPAVVAFLPCRSDLAMRATVLVYTLLRDDDKILDGIRFHPGYTENDAAFETFADAVDAMEVW
ncbi:MAG: hypothetical protein H0U55_16815 [Rubrobacteraceae bacterium]|nr:hypothetical protein [Rubrobacteraceae bacterium]